MGGEVQGAGGSSFDVNFFFSSFPQPPCFPFFACPILSSFPFLPILPLFLIPSISLSPFSLPLKSPQDTLSTFRTPLRIPPGIWEPSLLLSTLPSSLIQVGTPLILWQKKSKTQKGKGGVTLLLPSLAGTPADSARLALFFLIPSSPCSMFSS